MSTLFLIRHAQASFGAANYDQLSKLGFTQASRLGLWLSQHVGELDSILCGPCVRHRQTAEATLQLQAATQEPEIVDELDEFDAFRVFEWFMQHGDPKRVQEIGRLMPDKNPASARKLGTLLEGVTLEWARGEYTIADLPTWAETRARMELGVSKVLKTIGDNEKVAVFTSGGPVGVAVGMALGLSHEKTMEVCWALHNASFSKFYVQDSTLRLGGLNHLPHITEPSLITRR